MKNWLLTALTGVFVLATATAGTVAAPGQPTPWKVGDVFVGVGGGAYRVLTPNGVLKTDEPDLLDFSADQTTGCAVDVTTGDLFTTAFQNMAMSRFAGGDPLAAVAPHPLVGSINVSNLALGPLGKLPPIELLNLNMEMAVESVVFNRAGEMYVGAQALPDNAIDWRGHAWILKLSRAGALLDWWQVDAGDELRNSLPAFVTVPVLDPVTGLPALDPVTGLPLLEPELDPLTGLPVLDLVTGLPVPKRVRNPAIPLDVHGADWLDLSQDETTIYYTSEDAFIRSFHVAGPLAGTQGPTISIRAPGPTDKDGNPTSARIGGKAFALRILPPGDPANGFLVATSAAVYRLDGTGLIQQGFYQNGVANYFALNLTPDGRSFWTAAFDATIYKFHIASFNGFRRDANGNLIVDVNGNPILNQPGSMLAFGTAANSLDVSGICIKREYTASQNVCFVTDLDGNTTPNPSDPTGFLTRVCTLPPLGGFCLRNATDPECVTPGTPTLLLADQIGSEGVVIDPLTIQATNPFGGALNWTSTNLPPGLSLVNGVVTGTIESASTRFADTSRVVDGVVYPGFTVRVTVTNAALQSATGTFAWVITGKRNAAPTLDPLDPTPDPTVGVTVGFPFAPPIQLHAADADGNTLFLKATTVMPDGSEILGLPSGMQLPRDGFDREAVLCSKALLNGAGGCNIVLTGLPNMPVTCSTPAAPCTLTFRITVEAVDRDGDWDHLDPLQFAAHHKSTTFKVIISNRIPSFTALNQLTVQGAPATYSGLQTTADDPDDTAHLGVTNHRPLTFTIVAGALPAGLTMAPNGVISGTPTEVGSFTLTVRGTDTYSAYVEKTFTWDVIQKPADQITRVNTAVSPAVQLPGLPNGNGVTYTVPALPPGLSMTPAGVISGTPNTVSVTPFVVNVTFKDNFTNLTATTSFTWTIITPPTITVAPRINKVGVAVPPNFSVCNAASCGTAPVAVPTHALLYEFATGVLPSGLTMNPATGIITNTPGPDTPISENFSIKVTDLVNGLSTTSATTTWLVWNDPLLVIPDQSTQLGTGAISYQLPGQARPGGLTLTYARTGGAFPAGLLLNTRTGVVSGTPTATINAATITIQVTQATPNVNPSPIATATFKWVVYQLGSVTPASQVSALGRPITTYTPTTANFPASQLPLSWSYQGLPAGLTFSTTTGQVTGTPTAAVVGQSVTVTVTDALGKVSTAPFLWTVDAAPVVSPVNQLSVVGTAIVGYQVSATDAEGNLPLTFTFAGLPAGLTGSASGLVTGTPTTGNIAGSTVTVTVKDSLNISASATFLWVVNTPPTLTPVAQTSALNLAASYQIPASDADGQALTWSVSGLPTGLSANATGLVTGTPTVLGTFSVSATVTDPMSASVTKLFPWTVISNRPPTCSVATVTPNLIWPPNHKYVPFFIQNVTDPDGVTLLITSITQDQPIDGEGDGHTQADGIGVGSSSGSVRAERTGDLRVPDDGRLYQVNFSATDAKGAACTGTVFIGVPHDQGQHNLPSDNGCRWNSTNGDLLAPCAWLHAPVLDAPDRTNYESDAISLQLTAVDADGTPLTYTASGLPPGLSMSASGLITGTIPVGAAAGKTYKKFTVTVTVNDGYGADTDTFYWTVKPRLATPVMSTLPDRTNFETDHIDVQFEAVGPIGAPLTFSLVTGSVLPAGLTLSATGRISGTIAAGAAGSGSSKTYTITVKVTSGAASDTDTFTWTVKKLGSGHHDGDGCGNEHHDGHHSDDNDHDGDHGDDDHHHESDHHSDHDDGDDEDHRECDRNGGPKITKPADRNDNDGANCLLRVQGSDGRNHRLNYTAANLPPGVSMTSDGTISGKLDSAAHGKTYSVKLTGSDGRHSCQQSFTWKVK